MPNTIQIEGIPGAGKSTTAERLSCILQCQGIEATWWLEESADHPIMPKQTRALAKQTNFAELCLQRWQQFLNTQTCAVSVLDGYVFQSTVRFLFENLVQPKQIHEYFRRWQQLAPETSIIYLAVDNPVDHYQQVLPARGQAWTQKLVAWTEQTPFGLACKRHGQPGFIYFWSSYQALCLELLAAATVPVDIIAARSWDEDSLQALAQRHSLPVNAG